MADEPRAALIGGDILAAGGSAADAAVATYFAMSVTYPSSATLGGGGMCVVYSPRLNRVEALDFTLRLPARPGSVATPANARGMYALHGKFGKLRWEQLVAPAEALARFGTPTSRALAQELAAAAPILARDADASRIFLRADGTALREGDTLVQQELSGVLAAIRARGPGELHAGALARRFVEAANQAGASLTTEEMRAYLPAARPTVIVRHEDVALHFAPPPAAGGLVEAQLFAMLSPRWQRVSAEERPHLVAEAQIRAARDRERWLAADLSTIASVSELVGGAHIDRLMGDYQANRRASPASPRPTPGQSQPNAAVASFVAVDREGGAVACTVSANGSFGVGRVAPGLGIVLAAAPGAPGDERQSLGPVVVVRPRAGQVVFAGSAGGGWAGAAALATVALQVVVDERRLEEAGGAARIYYASDADRVLVEGQAPPGLTARGYKASSTPSLGRVNAILCPDGLADQPDTCQFHADRRGFGLAVVGK